MSLNAEQKLRTSRELQANRQLCPLDDQTICSALGWTEKQLNDHLAVNAESNPGDVWLLRDFLEQAITDLGGTPQPFTILVPEGRAQSMRWFGARTVPPTPRGDK